MAKKAKKAAKKAVKKSSPSNFIQTRHFKERLTERGISESDAISTVLSPTSKERQGWGTAGGYCYKFIDGHDNRKLCVIAEIHKEDCYMITAYWV